MTTETKDLPPIAPFIVHAVYDWINSFGGTAYIRLYADFVKDPVLQRYRTKAPVADGLDTIILNVSPSAAPNINFGESLTFSCRFGGKEHDVVVAYEQIEAIYDRETIAGSPITPYGAALEWFNETTEQPQPVRQKPALKVVH